MSDTDTVHAIDVDDQRRALRAHGARAAAARSLPARHTRPARHAHRLRHRQLRRLHGDLGRQADQELHDARAAGRRRRDRDGRGNRAGRRADRRCSRPSTSTTALQCGYCTSGHADVGDLPAAQQPEPGRRGDPPRRSAGTSAAAPATSTSSIDRVRARRRQRRRGGMHERPPRRDSDERRRASRATRALDRAPAFRARRTAAPARARRVHRRRRPCIAQGYAHFVRSPYAPRADRLDRHAPRAESLDGVYATLTGDEAKELARALLPDRPRARRADRRVLPRRRQGPLPGRRGRGRARRDPRASPATPPSSSRCEYEPLPAVVDTRRARPSPTRRCCTSRSARTSSGTASTTTATSTGRCRNADHVVEDRPPALPPLLLDAARVQRRGGQLGRRHRHDRDPLEQPDADVRLAGDRPGARRRLATSCCSARRTSAARSGSRSAATRRSRRSRCSPARPGVRRSGPSTAPTTCCPPATATSARSSTSRSPVMSDGTILGFKVEAYDDAGAYLHYEPLGAVIWSQVVPRLLQAQAHPRRLHRDASPTSARRSPTAATRACSTCG